MISSTLSLFSFVTLSIAQTTTVSLLLPNADPQPLVGSIAGSDSSATTYVIQCANSTSTQANKKRLVAAATTDAGAAMTTSGPSPEDGSDGSDDGSDDSDSCGFPSPITVTQGPSTLHYSVSSGADIGTIDCVLSGSAGGVCTAGGSGPDFSSASIGNQTMSVNGTDLSSFLLPVTITASASTTSGSASGARATSASSGGSPSKTASAGSTGTSSAGTSKSTGGAGLMVEPALGMGIAGIVAVGVAAAML